MFQGYHPPHYNPRQQPPPPDEVPQAVFEAAQLVKASHLSADGKYCYCRRYNQVLEAKYDGVQFGAWLTIGDEIPEGAVAL